MISPPPANFWPVLVLTKPAQCRPSTQPAPRQSLPISACALAEGRINHDVIWISMWHNSTYRTQLSQIHQESHLHAERSAEPWDHPGLATDCALASRHNLHIRHDMSVVFAIRVNSTSTCSRPRSLIFSWLRWMSLTIGSCSERSMHHWTIWWNTTVLWWNYGILLPNTTNKYNILIYVWNHRQNSGMSGRDFELPQAHHSNPSSTCPSISRLYA